MNIGKKNYINKIKILNNKIKYRGKRKNYTYKNIKSFLKITTMEVCKYSILLELHEDFYFEKESDCNCD